MSGYSASARSPARSGRRLRAVLALVRWPNALTAAAGVMAGSWWAVHALGGATLLAAGAAIAIAAAANAWNDAADLDIDRLVHAERPLPRGALSVGAAQAIGGAAALVALLLAAASSAALLPLTAAVLVVAWAYSPWIKQRGLAGNLTVAFVGSLPFLYGAWAAGRPRAGWVLVAIAAPLHLARELAKDLDDAAGDAGRRLTLPVAAGVPATQRLLCGSLALFVVLLVPLAAGHRLLALSLLPAVILCACAARLVLRRERGAPRLLKAAMLAGIAALLVGAP